MSRLGHTKGPSRGKNELNKDLSFLRVKDLRLKICWDD